MSLIMRRGFLASVIAGMVVFSPFVANAETHQVSIEGFSFMPASLEVSAGDTIVFTNLDSAPHTATALDGSFDTGRLSKGQSGEITISSAGSYDFKCNFHGSMTGQIVAN